MLATFKDDEEIIDLVQRFEACEINPADFRHYQHLTVALWYIREFPYDIASDKLRAGIKQLAAAYGKTGYHETITLFWLMVVRDFVAKASPTESICDLSNRLITSCTGKDLVNEYYSEELIASPEAKHRWVEPDLKSLRWRWSQYHLRERWITALVSPRFGMIHLLTQVVLTRHLDRKRRRRCALPPHSKQ